MAGAPCSVVILYSTPALVLTKEKVGPKAGVTTKKKTEISIDEDKVPRGGQIFSQIAEHLFSRKKYREALLLSDTAIELDDSLTTPYLLRAYALIRLGRYNEAHQELDHIADQTNPRVFMLRTMASWYAGEFEQAAVSASRGNRARAQPPTFKEMLNSYEGWFNCRVRSVPYSFVPGSEELENEITCNRSETESKMLIKYGVYNAPFTRPHAFILFNLVPVGYPKALLLCEKHSEIPTHCTFLSNCFAIGSIERCIGPSSGDILLEFSNEIFELDKRNQMKERTAGPKRYCEVGSSDTGDRKSTAANAFRTQRCEMYKKELTLYHMQLQMGRLVGSSQFMSSLPAMPGFVSANHKGVDRMRLLIKCIMKDLENRVTELMSDMPMYVYNRIAFIKKSAKLQNVNKTRQEDIVQQSRKLVEYMITKILIAREKKIPLSSLEACHRARNVLVNIPKKVLQDKRIYVNILYQLMGVVLLESKLLDPNLTEAANRKNIQGWLKLSNENPILRNSSFPFIDYKSLLNFAMRTYPQSPTHLERAWLLLVIAVSNSAYGNVDGCRIHARRAVAEARAAGSNVWAINALVVQAQAELKRNSKLDAKNCIKEAIELAEELNDESIIEALALMNDVVEEQSLDVDPLVEERRFNKNLVAMMPTHDMKNQMRHILHHRSSLGLSRRLHLTIRRDSPPHLGDTADNVAKAKKVPLWPRRKKSN